MKETRGAPEWEQILSAGAACMKPMHCGQRAGLRLELGDGVVSFIQKPSAKACGLAANERIAGFVHIGTLRKSRRSVSGRRWKMSCLAGGLEQGRGRFDSEQSVHCKS